MNRNNKNSWNLSELNGILPNFQFILGKPIIAATYQQVQQEAQHLQMLQQLQSQH